MTILLVDDQMSILSGLISGIDWDALGVSQIRSACNAFQAKKILEQEPVDILLCDIEMPGEDGLSLLRWARKKEMGFICIFLTAHADFLYAKEAILLDCFDYILQPARYEDIQKAVAKAIARAKKTDIEKELEQYGMVAKNYDSGLFQTLFTDWIAGKPFLISTLQSMLRQLGHQISPDNQCSVVWGQLLRWRSEPWSAHDWVYAANNMMAEIYEAAGLKILPFSIDHTSLGWFTWVPPGHAFDPQGFVSLSNSAYFAVDAYLPCDFAFYVSPVFCLEEINQQAQGLVRAKQDNVFQRKGVFQTDDSANAVRPSKVVDAALLNQWESLLATGEDQIVYREICRFWDGMNSDASINLQMMHDFWVQFLYIVLNAARKRGLDTRELFPALSSGEKVQSIQEMKEAVQTITEYFHQEDTADTKANVVNEVKKYVEDNMNMPFTISDIAAAVHMNADYLSRVFKKECGTTLKDYTIQRKMESAQILLRTTALPIGVIASKLGYDNYSHFSQIYRKTFGISPSDERRGPL